MSGVVEETNTFAFTGPTNAVSLSNGCVVNVTPELSAVARLGCLRGLHHEESVLKTDFS